MAGKGFKQFLGAEGEEEQGARTLPCPCPPQPTAVTQGQGTPREGALACVPPAAHAPCAPTALKCPRPGDTCPTLDANLPSL